MGSRKEEHDDVSLPFSTLQLLAPPVRLVTAALWKVVQQRDVLQYGVVEEFVTAACEAVRGLLTPRHQARLAVGLRARMIVELCALEPDAKKIQPHLDRIRARSIPGVDVTVDHTVDDFHEFVNDLLSDSAWREKFYKEEFHLKYGPTFDLELEKLLWEFLVRLDQLLPIPSLAQTVAWSRDTPPVMEECAKAGSKTQLLDIIKQHQKCLGHLEAAESLPAHMRASILASLSLPPSGWIGESAGSDPKDGSEGGQASSCGGAGRQRQQPQDGEREFSEEVQDDAIPSRPTKTKISTQGAHRTTSVASLRSTVDACLNSEVRVVVEKLPAQVVAAKRARRVSPVKAPKRQRGEAQAQFVDDKENLPQSSIASLSAPRQRDAPVRLAVPRGDDYVADSEDEATKNFKGRLFTKRYYKTKHGTYVPTLREFWKPGLAHCSFLSASSKHR
ncbi:unnamed protein product [Ophioblennius macclurei]